MRLTVKMRAGSSIEPCDRLGTMRPRRGRLRPSDRLRAAGVTYGGLARAVSIAERTMRTGVSQAPIRLAKETPVSASIDGADHIGYVVAIRAMELAIEKASASGIAIVVPANLVHGHAVLLRGDGGRSRLVSIIASNASPWVAPHGATEDDSAPTRSASASGRRRTGDLGHRHVRHHACGVKLAEQRVNRFRKAWP